MQIDGILLFPSKKILKMQNESIEEKQQYLRKEILESGLEAEPFMIFMGSIKNEGEEIKLESWTMNDIQKAVKQYKQILKEEKKWQQERQTTSQATKGSKEVMTSKIMETVIKKNKVSYDRDGLWDYQIYTQHECKKVRKKFDFKFPPQIDYMSWDIIKKGGFIFGLGATNELSVTLTTNFTQKPVTRNNEDFDWLREILVDKFPGYYVPPLGKIRHVEPEDKMGIMKRVKQIILFLNSLTRFEDLVQNEYFYKFISEIEQKKFKSFKNIKQATKLTGDLTSIENLQGRFHVQISNRMNRFVNDSSSFARQVNSIYENMTNNLHKLMGDMETFTKHSYYLANDYAKMHEAYLKMTNSCQIKDDGMVNVMLYLNNLFSSLGESMKKNLSLLKELSGDFIKYSQDEWAQFLIHQKKYNYELSNYLGFKLNLLRKKQKCFPDMQKWQLNQQQQFRMSRTNIDHWNKDDAFEIMLPKQNKIEEQMKIWQAYKNNMYESSYRALLREQEELYVRNFGRYCAKVSKIAQDQLCVYTKFKEMFDVDGKK